jgi:hypothetical protein
VKASSEGLKGLRKTTEISVKVPTLLNWKPPKHEAEELTITTQYSES